MTLTASALLATVRDNPGDTHARMVYADTIEEAGDTLGAILQRIIAIPDDDGLRLDYAAELERTAGAVACGCDDGSQDTGGFTPWGEPISARCNICDGTGRVSDGRAELAEFVRVQVELAKRNPRDCNQGTCRTGGRDRPCTACREREELQARERELWGYLPTRNGVRSYFESTLPGAAFCPESDGGKHLGSGFPIVLIQRGLPSVVRCTLAEWMGEPCSQCSGRGHRTLYGDGSGPWAKCQYCVDGRTPGIGPRLAQRWPIVAVEVTNREPSDGSVTRWNGFAGGYGWFRVEVFPGNPNEREDLPKEVFDRLTGGQIIDKDTNWRVYDSEHAARAALSDAMLAWARGQEVEEER